MSDSKESGGIMEHTWIQKTILEKLKELGRGLEIKDLLKDPNLIKSINYPPAYERIIRWNIRQLVEQGYLCSDERLYDEWTNPQGYVIRRYREFPASAVVEITDEGRDYLRFLDEEFKEKKDEITARIIPIERPSVTPSSLLGLIGGCLKGEFCLFLGAGASVSAGIPCGKEFRNKVLRSVYNIDENTAEAKFKMEFKNKIKNQKLTLEMILSGLKEKFGSSALRAVQNEVNRNLEPSTGYYSLAYLVRHGFFKVIFTVNFDELLEKALNEELGPGKYSVICTSDEFKSLTPSPPSSLKEPLLIKIHGTYKFESTLTVSWEDVQSLPPEKEKFLSYYAANYPLIFVGYSGRDPDIRSVLYQSSKSADHKIFWVSPNLLQEEAKGILRWFSSDPLNNHIKMKADDFFDELEHQLIGGYPCLKNEVSVAILNSGAIDRKTGITHKQIMEEILKHPSWGHKLSQHYKGRKNRLVRDIIASCESLIEKGHIEYEGEGKKRKYWD